ncbi:adenosylmethionine-8-amino-7-oxononanoate aminotransferase [Alishewanella sp. WH16-1]|uniref:adenosylmethionine--8-amino-7-oxononanoate transaminase n=1 Tax=Alishewanella sp. WH16-1 TaxID=1651088 RepID=UPI00071017F6|nr:adenosylmethionine--8-amino-7-oxononanoate transaminase [Alishewanella sp. WH16-1]KRS22556.1 adenosylmethionine-8-amino-7-oxononanoate aminotransferase [Alishewanella sp. WH16-1]
MSADLDFDRQHIWHPYTSMLTPLPVYPIVRADGCELELEDGRKLIDGTASWWSAVHGYNHPRLNQAISSQLSQMAHVMFGGITHQPAVALCQQLLKMVPANLSKVFLADSGSIAVEVALKMALQYWQGVGQTQKTRLVSLRKGYHGDTFAAMAVCDPHDSMHTMFSKLLPQHDFLPAPQSAFAGPFDDNDLTPLRDLLRQSANDIAAIILEPIVQGYGGMRFYHPNYLRGVRGLCDQYQVLLIADEIATGFGRSGKLFACEHAAITPDIMCLGKALSGGYLTLAATLCSAEIARGISLSAAGGLMHGPTFMANPLACAVALESIRIIAEGHWQQQVAAIEQQLSAELAPCANLATVKQVRVLGAIGVLEMRQKVDVAKLQAQFVERGVWVRPFNNLIYIMPPFTISSAQLSRLCWSMYEVASSC